MSGSPPPQVPEDPRPTPTGTEPKPVDAPPGLKQRAVSGVLWTAAQKWSVRLSTLAGFVVLGNLLEPREFGVVALAMSVVSLLTTLSDGGFAGYLLQKRVLTGRDASTAFIATTALSVVLALGLVAAAGPLAAALDVPDLRLVLPALAVALVVSGLSVVPTALLQRDLRFKQLAVRTVVAALVSVAAAVGLALAGAGVWALVGQTLVRTVVALVMLAAASDFRPRWVLDRAEMKAMTSYGSKTLLVSLASALRSQGEVFIIGALAGPVVLGYWAVAGRLVSVVVDVFASVVGAVAHPVFARLQDDPARLARALGSSRALSALVLVPGLVLLSLVSEDLVPAVFGEQWTPTTTVAALLALSAVLQSMSNFDRSALMATGHPGAELAVTLVFITMQLGLAVVFADRLELLAAGIGTTMALSIPVRLLVVRRTLRVPLRAFGPSLALLLAGGLAAGAVLLVRVGLGLDGWASVGTTVGVGAVVYLSAVLLVARPVALEAVGMARGIVHRR